MNYYNLWLILSYVFTVLFYKIRVTEGIVGGSVVTYDRDKFKYTVSIQGSNGHICSGAVVRPNFALSAAHCFLDQNGKPLIDHFHVVGGITRLQIDHATRVMYPIKKAYIPTEYQRVEPARNVREKANIALLETRDKMKLGETPNLPVKRVKLPVPICYKYLRYRGEIIVTGFGLEAPQNVGDKRGRDTEEIGFNCDHLKKADGAVLDVRSCNSMYSQNIFDEHICAEVDQRHGPAGVCYGDEGAPLIFQRDNTLIGILGRIHGSCDDNKTPGVYTRITSYMTFFENVLDKNRLSKVVVIDYDKILPEKSKGFKNSASSSRSDH